jgi:preprotein translocase subunit SecA
MFEGMLESLREKVTNALCLIELHAESDAPPLPQPKAPTRTIMSHGADAAPAPQSMIPKPLEAQLFDKDDPKSWANTPRNAPCPCGSGKKYKYCHGKDAWE